jgi:hypothetical protein
MTRRLLVLAFVPFVQIGNYARLKLASDEFFTQSDLWVKRMNERPGTLNAGAVSAWKPLPGMWRKFEEAWRAWIS